jgi:uncharacterized protein (DUF983 family)
MFGTAFFIQGCPTCGRRLQVRVTYLGKKVACKHCRAEFTACDPDSRPVATADSSHIVLMDRVEALLASVEGAKRRPR